MRIVAPNFEVFDNLIRHKNNFTARNAKDIYPDERTRIEARG